MAYLKWNQSQNLKELSIYAKYWIGFNEQFQFNSDLFYRTDCNFYYDFISRIWSVKIRNQCDIIHGPIIKITGLKPETTTKLRIIYGFTHCEPLDM